MAFSVSGFRWVLIREFCSGRVSLGASEQLVTEAEEPYLYLVERRSLTGRFASYVIVLFYGYTSSRGESYLHSDRANNGVHLSRRCRHARLL